MGNFPHRARPGIFGICTGRLKLKLGIFTQFEKPFVPRYFKDPGLARYIALYTIVYKTI